MIPMIRIQNSPHPIKNVIGEILEPFLIVIIGACTIWGIADATGGMIGTCTVGLLGGVLITAGILIAGVVITGTGVISIGWFMTEGGCTITEGIDRGIVASTTCGRGVCTVWGITDTTDGCIAGMVGACIVGMTGIGVDVSCIVGNGIFSTDGIIGFTSTIVCIGDSSVVVGLQKISQRLISGCGVFGLVSIGCTDVLSDTVVLLLLVSVMVYDWYYKTYIYLDTTCLYELCNFFIPICFISNWQFLFICSDY